MREGYIYCRHHYELLLTGEYAGPGPVPDFVQFSPTEQIPYIPPVTVGQKGRPRKRKSQHEDMSSLGIGPGLHGEYRVIYLVGWMSIVASFCGRELTRR